ncbi:hypothetical protein JW906_12020 [bacterium]|nr:hypothetical protein [bacterium]
MNRAVQSIKTPFRFFTRLHLTELTGLKAASLVELARLIREVPGSSIYHHTHRFLQQHLYLSPEPPNDFAYWTTGVLGEERLGEILASIDTMQFKDIRSLREKISETLEDYVNAHPKVSLKFADPGEEFHFMKSVSFVLPTSHSAASLEDFTDILGKITIDSIYYHIFEARLRLEKPTNDFSLWLEQSCGRPELANEIGRLDPYTRTMEGLRKALLDILRKGIAK